MIPAINLKISAILLILFFLHPVFSQETDLEKDTIQIKEVLVTKNSKKLKIKTLMLDGSCYYPENMHNAEEIITLADKLPEGTLESISFYFNELPRRGQEEKSRDNEFELVLYTADADGIPSDRIVHEPLTVMVSRKFTGRLTIDVSILAIESSKRMFVGLKRLTQPKDKDEFFIDCLCNGLDKYITMVRKNAASPWERRWQCAALKTEVGVAVHK
ncbi:MAG: hypothetical protein V4581_07815 [Bacteroidota bacterium]